MPGKISDFPTLISYWDTERNSNIRPDSLKITSRKRAYWLCPNCDYQWFAAISSVYKKSQKYPTFCPCCDLGEVLVKGVSSISDKFPDFINYLNFHYEDYDSIQDLLENEPFGSSRVFYFKCPTCHTSWKDVANSPLLSQSDNRDLYHIGCNEKSYHYEYKHVYPNLRKIYRKKVNKPSIQTLKLSDNVTIPRHWQCNICHYQFELSIDRLFNQVMRKGYYCPNCQSSFKYPFGKNKKRIPLSYISEDYLEEWSHDNYSLKENQVDLLSNINVRWICKHCQGIYTCTVSEKRRYICPYCSDREMYKGVNTLQDTHSYLQNFWHPDNLEKLSDYWYKSAEELLWRCPCCLVDFNCSPVEMISRTDLENQNFQTCPNMCDWATEIFHNDLFYDTPKLVNEWSNKNGIPIHLAVTNIETKKYWWTCSTCHGEYMASIPIRREVEQICPYCNHEELLERYNSLGALYPDLASIFSDKNEDTADSVLYDKFDRKIYHWQCNDCHLTFDETLNTIVNLYLNNGHANIQNVCPYCNKRLPIPHVTSLDAAKPFLVEEWLSKHNGDIAKVFPNSDEYIFWECRVCHRHFEAFINEREENDKCCYFCNGERPIRGLTDLQTTHPEIAKQWSEKNNKKATDIKADWECQAFWVCTKCHGTYSEIISKYVQGNSECPYCSNMKALAGFNTLDVTHPHLIDEWASSNKLSSSEVMKTSARNVNWCCQSCHGEYTAKIKERVQKCFECPYCSNKKVLSVDLIA